MLWIRISNLNFRNTIKLDSSQIYQASKLLLLIVTVAQALRDMQNLDLGLPFPVLVCLCDNRGHQKLYFENE
jgi:hypothetical protein